MPREKTSYYYGQGTKYSMDANADRRAEKRYFTEAARMADEMVKRQKERRKKQQELENVSRPTSYPIEPVSCPKTSAPIKQVLVIANHRNLVMSNMSSLWKKGKLCDAGISNGIATVKVHKVVLSAVCPRLLSQFSPNAISQKYLHVNLPKEVSMAALNAFAEYMYDGMLNLDLNILKHLKIIAKKLDMKEFEKLCDSHLPNDFPQTPAAAKLPMIQKLKSVTAMTSSHATLDSPNTMDSTSSVPTQDVDINQESMEVEQGQVKMETGHMFGQSGNDISPNIKTEPVETDNNEYGHLSSSSSSNQVFTPTTSPSSAASTSSTECSISFSQSTGVKSTKLKPTHSYEIPLEADLSPISRSGETVCSQSNEDSSKPSRQSISTSSSELPSTNDAGIYPVALFMAGGDCVRMLTSNAIDLSNTDLT